MSAHDPFVRVERALRRMEGSGLFVCLVASRRAAEAARDQIARRCKDLGRHVVGWDSPAIPGRIEASVMVVDGATPADRRRQLTDLNLARDAARFQQRAAFVVVLRELVAELAEGAPDAWSVRTDVINLNDLNIKYMSGPQPLRLEPTAELSPALARLVERTALSGLEGTDGMSKPRLRLSDLAVEVRAVGPSLADGEQGPEGEAVDVLLGNPVSLLLGVAGAGKTTVLRRMAERLARAGREVALVDASEPALVGVSIGDLPDALARICGACAWGPRPTAQPWVLVDGLDELMDPIERARLALLVDDLVLVGLAAGATLATRDEGEEALLFERVQRRDDAEDGVMVDLVKASHALPQVRLLPLDEPQVREYLHRWVRLTVPEPEARALRLERLEAAIRLVEDRGFIQNLARTPLLLAAFAASGARGEGEVTGEAALLGAWVDALIQDRAGRDARRSAAELRDLAGELAWALFQRGRARLSVDELRQASARLDEPALDALELGTGLLVRETDGLGFQHAALRDLLVAEQLTRRLEWGSELLAAVLVRAGKIDGARGAVRVGRLFLEVEGRRDPELLEACIDRSLGMPPNATLSSELVVLTPAFGWCLLIASTWGRSPPQRFRKLHERMRGWLVHSARAPQGEALVRELAALLKALLGDGELEQVRFVEVAEGWSLAIWPISRSLYAEFMAAGGYTHRPWWDAAGWRWCQRASGARRKDQPDRWETDDDSHPLAPVRGLSVHEARAFTRWYAATHEPRAALPPRWLWEAAARNAPGWEQALPRRLVVFTPLVACAPHLASAQGVEDLGGVVRQWLDDGDGRAVSAGYAWCDEPIPLQGSIQDHSHDGRRWYHPFGLRLALKPR